MGQISQVDQTDQMGQFDLGGINHINVSVQLVI